jgi:hypothetical protein
MGLLASIAEGVEVGQVGGSGELLNPSDQPAHQKERFLAQLLRSYPNSTVRVATKGRSSTSN